MLNAFAQRAVEYALGVADADGFDEGVEADNLPAGEGSGDAVIESRILQRFGSAPGDSQLTGVDIFPLL